MTDPISPEYRPPGFISPGTALEMVIEAEFELETKAISEVAGRIFIAWLTRTEHQERKEINTYVIDALDADIAELQVQQFKKWDKLHKKSQSILRDLLFLGKLVAVYFDPNISERQTVPADFWGSSLAASTLMMGKYARLSSTGDVKFFSLSIPKAKLEAVLRSSKGSTAVLPHRPPNQRLAAEWALRTLFPNNNFAEVKATSLLVEVNDLLRREGKPNIGRDTLRRARNREFARAKG